MLKRSHILSFICVFGLVSLCLTNGFADDDVAVLEGDFEFPTPDGPEYFQGTPEFQRAPENIIGTADFEKMRDLPTNSQDYSLGTKVGWFAIRQRNSLTLYWICTGFLVGPDLFMTAHHCIYDNLGLRPLGGARIYMDYYQELSVDRTRGGITAGVLEVLRADARKDYALLRLDKPIGNTYGWLDLDSTTRVDPSQSVKIIQHPDGRSKEIVRRNSRIVKFPPHVLAPAYLLVYLADTEPGSSGSPVFLRDGTGVIGIHHSGFRNFGNPVFNGGSLMSHIVPEIQQWLPGGSLPTPTLTATTGEGQSAPVNQQLANPLVVRVKDQNDAAMSGVSVSFSVTPSATLNPSSATTGANGEAQTRLTLGSTAGTYTVTARATGITQPATFTATATPSPFAFDPSTIADQTFTVGTAVNLTLPIATGGTAPYTYTLSPIPAGLSFTAASRTLSGTPTTAGTTNATYTATDANQQIASLNFTVQVTPTPITFNPNTIADQTFTVGTAVNLTLPIATGGTAPYTYTLSPIPTGLSFTAASRSLSGTPTTAGITTNVTYTATDASRKTASLNFTVRVIAPLTFNPNTIADQTFTVGTAVNLTLPIATGGTAPYTYTLSPIPTGLSFTAAAASRSLSGTPTTAGTTNVIYTATDASRKTASLNFTVQVTPTPITFNPNTIADQMFVANTPIEPLDLPVALGGTPPYTYTLEPLPNGLVFDASNRTLSGTPTILAPATSVTYTATDATNASIALTFTIEVTVDMTLDVNGDGEVTVIDLAMVAIFYGTQVPDGVDLIADVNDDGTVDILDLTAVAQAIEVSAGNNSALSADDVEAVLEAIAGIEGIAEAPARFSKERRRNRVTRFPLRAGVASRNVAAAFADTKHLATEDVRLGKWMPVFKELLHLLTEMREIPNTTALLPNYPNPFNPETWIPYHLSKGTDVTLTIHDVRGVLVRELTLGYQAAGVYESRSRAAYWDGRNAVGEPVASGLYFYTLTAGEFTATRKLLIVK